MGDVVHITVAPDGTGKPGWSQVDISRNTACFLQGKGNQFLNINAQFNVDSDISPCTPEVAECDNIHENLMNHFDLLDNAKDVPGSLLLCCFIPGNVCTHKMKIQGDFYLDTHRISSSELTGVERSVIDINGARVILNNIPIPQSNRILTNSSTVKIYDTMVNILVIEASKKHVNKTRSTQKPCTLRSMNIGIDNFCPTPSSMLRSKRSYESAKKHLIDTTISEMSSYYRDEGNLKPLTVIARAYTK